MLYNNSTLCDSSGYILIVIPKYNATNTSFNSTKFYYGAYRCVTWIKNLTIADTDFPTDKNNSNNITPQAIFAGYNSKASIRQKCRFKSRTSISIIDNGCELDQLILEYDDSKNTFNIPTNLLYGTKVKKIIIP